MQQVKGLGEQLHCPGMGILPVGVVALIGHRQYALDKGVPPPDTGRQLRFRCQEKKCLLHRLEHDQLSAIAGPVQQAGLVEQPDAVLPLLPLRRIFRQLLQQGCRQSAPV